jgi:phosphoribosyl 1,2-cyclic phosphodiesterase
MRLKLWGVRGSLPSPAAPERLRAHLVEVLGEYEARKKDFPALTPERFLDQLPPHLTGGYGGNTSCGEITYGKDRVLIDGGSGIRNFSDHIMQAEPTQTEFHIYLTHFHWDHLIGLPFFVPLYLKGKAVHFYGAHDDLEEAIRILFRKPQFPVPFKVISPQIHVHKVKPREAFEIGGISVTPYQLDHPDPCWGARVEAGGKSIAWCVDTEGTRTTPEELGPDLPLYKNADVMVFDAQYSFSEALEKINWGHSSGPIGIDLALREGVKRVVFMHHDPSASDESIWTGEQQTKSYYSELLRAREKAGFKDSGLDWHFAIEGESIDL